ncbi:40S ribosomal protein S27 [Fasciolopsis buskii]|uniref:40S ribosomal protein S27 n=1 Tax=Fasciolopsis buskii TaxID=27845 RepID=A0A8E0VHV3_9TREM|nr:40S ribosomal protein S27 [Fasciolopsis buski]
MPLAVDLLHPTLREEKRKCKLKRLVPSPNSFFMDVKCPGTTIYIRLLPRLLKNPNSLQPCADPSCMPRV